MIGFKDRRKNYTRTNKQFIHKQLCGDDDGDDDDDNDDGDDDDDDDDDNDDESDHDDEDDAQVPTTATFAAAAMTVSSPLKTIISTLQYTADHSLGEIRRTICLSCHLCQHMSLVPGSGILLLQQTTEDESPGEITLPSKYFISGCVHESWSRNKMNLELLGNVFCFSFNFK